MVFPELGVKYRDERAHARSKFTSFSAHDVCDRDFVLLWRRAICYPLPVLWMTSRRRVATAAVSLQHCIGVYPRVLLRGILVATTAGRQG